MKRIMQIDVNILKWIVTAIASSLLGFFVPIAGFIIAITFLVIADLYSGIKVAQHKKEAITSRGLKRTVAKITLYFFAIISARTIDVVFLVPHGYDFDVTWIVSGFIATTEFKSMLENTYIVTGVDVWRKIASYLPSFENKKENKKEE